MTTEFPKTGQGPAKIANEKDLQRDKTGFTNPNLHRRTDPKQSKDEKELKPRQYEFEIQDVNSYRTTMIIIHDEETDKPELP